MLVFLRALSPLECCRCMSRPAVCQERPAELAGAGQPVPDNLPTLFPSRAACCRPGLGAFAEGCRD